MWRGLDEREREAADRGRDVELTLSPATLLGIFFGLVLLCGLCFGLGYAVGHRSSPEPAAAAAQPAQGQEESAAPASSRAKPPATAQTNTAPQPARAVVDLPPSSNASGASGAGTSAGQKSSAAQWTVKPALPPEAIQSQPATGPAANLKVEPAMAPSQVLMVQIAAVSHQEDADVLVAALRKRGYAVTVHRDLADSLIHVQIGPFNNRNDANAMRQKLLNDGYNAIVEP